MMPNFSVGYQNIHGLHDKIGCKAGRLENELKMISKFGVKFGDVNAKLNSMIMILKLSNHKNT